MVLVTGTNCELVTSAPVTDPGEAQTWTMDGYARLLEVVPGSDVTITEIGFWAATATEEANWEAGIYEDDGFHDPDELIGVSRTNAKGTTSGWKTSTGLNISLTNGTIYWIAIQVDNTATTTTIDRGIESGTADYIFRSSMTTLPAPWQAGQSGVTRLAIYAVYEEAGGDGTNVQINIGDAWKTVDGLQINIGDAWKTVDGAQVNIGDAWKTIF